MYRIMRCLLLMILLVFLGGCSDDSSVNTNAAFVGSDVGAETTAKPDANENYYDSEMTGEKKPTIPQSIPIGTEYLYDFTFSERYDDKVTPEFSLVFDGNTLFLFDKFQNDTSPYKEYEYDGDGMVPHRYKRYWYATEAGNLVVGTDYYEPDNLEYLTYLWTDMVSAKTNEGISVGSSVDDLLLAYPDNLYFVGKDSATPELLVVDDVLKPAPYDSVYAWQPYSLETNDIRDITFYVENDIVVAIEIVEPFELRYVYGYDRTEGFD